MQCKNKILVFLTDGSLSDTAVGLRADEGNRLRARKNSPNNKSADGGTGGNTNQYQSGMGKKSNSTSQLSATGKKIIFN